MIIRNDKPQDSDSLKPEVGSSYSNGLNKMSKYFLDLLLITIVVFIIGVPSWLGSTITRGAEWNTLWNFFEFFYSILISGPLGYGMIYIYLKAARGEKPEIKDLTKVFDNYWNILLANIIVVIIICIGFFLLIIPGIIFACKLVFVPYLVVEYRMEAATAVQESWRMTNGHAFNIFVMGLLAIPVCIGGLILFGVGIILAGMWISLAFASYYHAVILRERKPITTETEQGPFK